MSQFNLYCCLILELTALCRDHQHGRRIKSISHSIYIDVYLYMLIIQTNQPTTQDSAVLLRPAASHTIPLTWTGELLQCATAGEKKKN